MRKLLPALMLLAPLAGHADGAPAAASACASPGLWLTALQAGVLPTGGAALLDRLADRQAVLLGERHDSLEDHRWQLHTLAQLHARRPDLAIGFEMFPRRLQPVLDRWVAGGLSETDFLREVDWNRVWRFDARGYLPLFHYARMNRLPMLALNVERELVAEVGRLGWDGVAEAAREGVTRPAPPTPEYRKALREVFDHHPARAGGEAAFPRFVEAQAVWDRAMAQGIAEHLRARPAALVVGIMGAGHVRDGHGVAHQLKDMGVQRVGALLTWDGRDGCTGITPGIADAVYVVNPPPDNPPRLGVAMEPHGQGVRIAQVTEGSVAARAGLRAGDLILEVAGRPARDPEDLRGAVQRQAPGTWLPLKVRREQTELEVVARFPADS